MAIDAVQGYALETLLAWIQINVAAGLLYIGLPAARHRNKLLDAIAERLEAESFEDEELWSRNSYLDLLRGPKFQKAHNLVATWFSELLESKTSKLSAVTAQFFAPQSEDGANKPPYSYLWFKNNLDKGMVILATFSSAYLFLLPFSRFAGSRRLRMWLRAF